MLLRNMTALYIVNREQVLLLYRVGSRVVGPSWCGIGGHFEPSELNDPTACVLRELREESGIGPEKIENLRLRYIAMRQKGGEVRQNYYFFATMPDEHRQEHYHCGEGRLAWTDIAALPTLEMPYSATHCLAHYFKTGVKDHLLYTGTAAGERFVVTPLQPYD